MTKRTRRNHSPAFKAKVALAAVKGEKMLASWLGSLTFTRTRSRPAAGCCWKALPEFSGRMATLNRRSRTT